MPLLEIPRTQKPPLGTPLDRANPVTQKIAAACTLNEGGGSLVYDISGNDNHGTLVGATWQAGAISLDGTADISIGNRPSLLSAGQAVMLWVRFSVSHSNKGLVSDWPGGGNERWMFWIPPGGVNTVGFVIRVGNANKEARSINAYNDNRWHHYMGFWDGSNVRLLVDGGRENITGTATTGPIDGDTSDVEIGVYDSTRAFTGQIDQVVVFNNTLSLGEANTLSSNPWQIYKPILIPFAAAAVGISIPVVQHHRQQQQVA